MYWLFGAENKELLKEILDDTDLQFSKWAIIQLTRRSNKESIDKLAKIHGGRDKLITYRENERTVAIEGGQHFMIVDKAEEISQIVEEKTTTQGNTP